MSRSRDAACSLSLVILGEVFWSGSVHACDNNVITLIRLQGHLLDRAELLLAEDLHLVGVDDFWGEGRVNARCLNSDDEVTSVLDEHAGVQTKNTGLIWLGDISENHITHGHEHSVLLGVSGVLDNRDDICSLLSHVDQVTSDTLREFDGVDGALGANEVRDVRYSGARGGANVKDLAARLDIDVIDTTCNTGGQL